MKVSLTFFFALLIVHGFAQNNSIMGQKDTLKLGYSTGGKIDSVDIAFSNHSSTLPGGGFSTSENILPYDFFIQNYGGGVYRNFSDWKNRRFSALPHLGFGYVFGGQATQNVIATYTQVFGPKNILNIDYNLRRGNAFLRSSDFNHNDVQVQFEHQSDFYSFDIRGQFVSRSIFENGGILTDTLLDISGLSFAPVRKSAAESRYKGTRIELDHYFDLLSNDSSNSTGIYVENRLNIQNRRYFEVDSFAAIYPVTYYSLDSTNDQYQVSELVNLAGLYYSRKGFYFKAGIQNNWWNFYNLGNFVSQSEINLDGKIGIILKGVELKNHSNLNFIGAKGEWFSNSAVKFGWNNFLLQGKANLSYLLPEPYQRLYFGNNIFYNNSFSDLEKQFRMNIDANLDYSYQQHSVGFFIKNAVATNNYWFYNDEWRNDTLTTLNSFSLGVRGKTNFKIIHFSFNGSYNNSNWMPDFFVQSRLYLQGKILKGRKLLGQFGVEGSYHTGYNLIAVNPLMDIYQLTNTSNDAMVNLHVFGAFEVQKFRFFFRVENLGYFWNPSVNRIAVDYPIPAMQIRVGITWDFFN